MPSHRENKRRGGAHATILSRLEHWRETLRDSSLIQRQKSSTNGFFRFLASSKEEFVLDQNSRVTKIQGYAEIFNTASSKVESAFITEQEVQVFLSGPGLRDCLLFS